MRTLASYGALALALAAAPAMLAAQDATMPDTDTTMSTPGTTSSMTAEQSTMYDAWPEDRRASFDTWPSDYQVYFWTLAPNQQTGYWALSDQQRGTIAQLTPEQRLAAWASIEKQMDAQSGGTSTPSSTSATVTGSGDAVTTAVTDPGTSTLPQTTTVMTTSGNFTPPPASAMNKDYPLCSRTIQDSCINPGEARRSARSGTAG